MLFIGSSTPYTGTQETYLIKCTEPALNCTQSALALLCTCVNELVLDFSPPSWGAHIPSVHTGAIRRDMAWREKWVHDVHSQDVSQISRANMLVAWMLAFHTECIITFWQIYLCDLYCVFVPCCDLCIMVDEVHVYNQLSNCLWFPTSSWFSWHFWRNALPLIGSLVWIC